MESWDNLILQWINCLLSSTGDSIQSIEELQDGKKYLKLISKVKHFKYKIDDDEVNERDNAIQFLKDEYPNVVFGTKSKTIENLCITLLILSRLSLEPTFHKSLCTNLNLDTQIRIKSILEALYPLGKKVTIDDLCSTFSLLDQSITGSISAKPKFLLEDFLNSPVTKSVHSDSNIHEQTKQIRHLQADLETVRYEKSELLEDIKIQKRQIDELHQKLQETLLELKALRHDSLKSTDFNGSYEPTTPKSCESSYEKELQSLENYISELQSDNFKLQDDKTNLLDKLKICQSKYSLIEEKSLKHEEVIESLLVQIEKKDNELLDLKIKYEELCCYLKEKSKPVFINQSFDIDESRVAEMSMNYSETLSSVIEVQLQDAKKEIVVAQNKYKSINSILTVIIEEYIKMKITVQTLLNDNTKMKAEYEEKYRIMNDQLQVLLNKEKLEEESELQKYNELDLSEIKQNIARILQGDSEQMKSILLKLLNQCNASKGCKKLRNHIDFTTDSGNNSHIIDPAYLNTLKSLQKYPGDNSINNLDKSRLVFKFYDILWQENWRKNLIIFFKTLLQNNISGSITGQTISHEKIFVKYHTIDAMLEKNLVKCLQDIYIKSEDRASLITKEDLELLRSDWTLLHNDLKNNLKIYKVLLLLEQKWKIVSETLRDYENYLIDDIRELFEKKDIIDSEFGKIFFMNSQILSSNFIAATQLTTKINKHSDKLYIEDVNDFMLQSETGEPTHSECIEKIISIKKSINDFEKLKQSIEAKPKVRIEWANISLQTETFPEPVEAEPVVKIECIDVSIQTDIPIEHLELEPVVKTDCVDCIDDSLQTDSFTNSLSTEIATETENVNVSLQTEDPTEVLETNPIVKIECANVSLQTDIVDEMESAIEKECIDSSMQTEDLLDIKVEPVETIECVNVSLQTDTVFEAENKIAVKIECANVSLQTDSLSELIEAKTEVANVSLQTDSLLQLQEAKTEVANASLQTDSVPEPIETQTPLKVECVNISIQTDNPEELLETKPTVKVECMDVSIQTENVSVSEPSEDVKNKIKIEKETFQQQSKSSKEISASETKNVLESEEVQNYVKELHQKYELKLDKMKEKMKAVYNSQMSALKKDQESGGTKKLKALEEQLEQQCHNHSEELKKYKKHVSELSTQLWDIGDKLLIEKQKKDDVIQKYKELKTRLDILEAHNSKGSKHEPKRQEHHALKAEVERPPLQQLDVSSLSKMQNVRNFQVMGNAFRTEDEEGELFDTTYNLSELQRSQNIPPPNDIDRLSILQMRNAKCKPHLKSSYAAEMQSYPLPVTEDEIKTGSATEEVFNDSLSQSLLTGKKVKRRDRTRNGSETPRRSTRRFSNIFRKPRLSLDRK